MQLGLCVSKCCAVSTQSPLPKRRYVEAEEATEEASEEPSVKPQFQAKLVCGILLHITE